MTRTSCTLVVSRTRKVLLREGLLPTKDMSPIQILKLVFHLIFHIVLFSIIIKNIINSIRTSDVILLNRVVCIALLPVITLLTKITTVLKNGECFLLVLKYLDSRVFNAHNDELNKNIQRVDYLLQIALRYYTMMAGLLLSVITLLPMVTDISLLLPMPYNLKKIEVYYKFLHSFIMLYLALNSISYDLMYLSLMGLCSAQVNILQAKLKDISNWRNENGKYHLVTEKVLKDCVILQELINKYVMKLTTLLSLPLFTQYLFGCLIICYAVLQLTLMKSSDVTSIVTVVAYAGVTFFQLAAYHWLGNEISYQSGKIIESSYLSYWYKLDLKSQKSLMLLMERAKRPLNLQLYNLVDISLDSLGVIIRWSYSLFALIKAKYN